MNIKQDEIDKIENILEEYQKGTLLPEDLDSELKWNDISKEKFESIITIKEKLRQKGLDDKLKLLKQYDKELDSDKGDKHTKEIYKSKKLNSNTYKILAIAAIISLLIFAIPGFYSTIGPKKTLDEIYSEFDPPASPDYLTRSIENGQEYTQEVIDIFKLYDQAQNYLNVEDYEKADELYKNVLVKMKKVDSIQFENYIKSIESILVR